MRTFTGYRPNPPAEYAAKGITNSGESADYQGVIFDDGTVVLRWLTEYKSHSVWASYDDFYKVHGHPEYGTRIEFDDEKVEPRKVYRITRYSPSGKVEWARLYTHTAGWPGTIGSLVDHGLTGKDYATLEIAEIDESLFSEIRRREADAS